MALTAPQFQAWLESSNSKRCILVEVIANIAGVETVLYLSNRNYATGSSDTPANTTYLPYIQTSLAFNQAITLDGSPSLSYGDIAIDNTNGVRDSWLNYIWANRKISIYIGDVSFNRSNFTNIYSGYVSDIASSDRNTLNISIRDLLQRLNTPMTSTLIGGTGPNKEILRPLCFGEVHNITPVLYDAPNLIYMVHNGPIESIIEVRDNGVPLPAGVSYTVDLNAGTFTLLRAAVGAITCSVQGEKNTVNSSGALVTGTYTNTVTRLIQLIVIKYGNLTLSATEMDITTMNTFEVNNPAPVGLYLNNNTNVITACQQLASAVGAQFTSNRLGLITLLKIDTPSSVGQTRFITDTDIILGSVSIEQKVAVQGAIKLGYCQNYTVQGDLLTGIPDVHKNMFSLAYLTATAKDTTVLTNYNLSSEPDIKYTNMVSNSPTTYITNEANRLLGLWKIPRFVYKLECTAKHLTVSLGEMVSLTHYRFGLSGSKYGQVISVSTNWDTGRVTLGILV